MIRLALSFAVAALLATGGWTAFGAEVAPHKPALRVIAHVYAREHRENVGASRAERAMPGRFL